MSRSSVLVTLMIVTALADPEPPVAMAVHSDSQALARVFGDQFLAEDVARVRREAARLAPEERYRFLLDWVLPSRRHQSLRVSAAFTPTFPVQPPLDGDPIDLARRQAGEERGEGRIQTGGLLVSPVFDLIDTARDLDRLAELRARVEQFLPEEGLAARQRLALLVLIDVAANNFDRALAFLDEMDQRIAERAYSDLADRWPETLVVWRTVEVPELQDLVDLLLQRILNDQVRPGNNNGPDPWDRLITALAGRSRYVHLDSVAASPVRPDRLGPRFDAPPSLQNWACVAGGDCTTRALGFPCSRWEWRAGVLDKLAGHQNDFLYFRIPLRGNYEVEGDLGGFNYRDTELMTAGAFDVLHVDHGRLDLRSLRGILARTELSPLLSQTGDWVHWRVVVRDGVCSTHFDGRLVHQRRLTAGSPPWLAIRSPFYGFSRVRDLRITGEPEIPEEIHIASDDSLSGWVTYFPEVVGGDAADWSFDRDLGPEGGLVARRKPEFAGSFQESLLRYHRPLLEDGVIEYEFFYQPGETHVHPAIDRKVYLIERESVCIHRVTDGVWDRSENDPRNAAPARDPAAPSGEERMPLVEGWNRLQFRLAGDSVSLRLNGELVHRSDLHPANDRTFGLFHYADQTGVRVRNMVWRGDWPRELPPLQDQELRRTEADLLDDTLPQLPAVFECDFQAEQDWSTRFNQYSSDGLGSVTSEEPGARMVHPGSRPFNNVWIAPSIRVRGDFDVVAEFEELETSTAGGKAGLYLTVVLTDSDTTHCDVFRGVVQHPDQRSRQIMEAELDYFQRNAIAIVYEGTASEASTAGRLRLARRGSTVSFLVSEADSPNWRLVHQQEVNDTPLNVNGVRLVAGTYADTNPLGNVSVLWKRLTVRAESIDGP